MNLAYAQQWPSDSSASWNADPQVELESVPCVLCGGHQFETVLFATDPTTKIGGRFRVVRCCDCRFVFTNPRPTEESIGFFYPPSYGPYSGRDDEPEQNHSWEHRLEGAVLRSDFGYPPQPVHPGDRLLSKVGRLLIRRTRRRQAWIPFREPGRLLDFGCGAGDFLRRMKGFGWSVEGLDMSEDVARSVQEKTGIRIHVGSLPHHDIQPETYDAVTMWNSLEHVHHPRQVVREAAKALRPGGLLVVGVPNFASWSFKAYQQHWYALELPRHLSHFTPESLQELIAGEGLRIHSLLHIGRSGCLRKSAKRATQAASGSWWSRACRWKPLCLMTTDWTERTGQADFIRVIAEKTTNFCSLSAKRMDLRS